VTISRERALECGGAAPHFTRAGQRTLSDPNRFASMAGNETFDLIRHFQLRFRRKHFCPNTAARFFAFVITGETAGGLRSALGSEEPDAR
jgi:hypothetical protein